MNKTLLLGDVHGAFEEMEFFIDFMLEQYPEITRIIQLGDFGYYPKLCQNRPNKVYEGVEKYFIRGNHENHFKLPLDAEEPVDMGEEWAHWNFVPDGCIMDNMLLIGGADSIDKKYRIIQEMNGFGKSWFPNEEERDEQKILTRIRKNSSRIKYVLTHDCPKKIAWIIHSGKLYPNRTGPFFNVVAREFQDVDWFFGHHHLQGSWDVDGCMYRLLDMVPMYSKQLIDRHTWNIKDFGSSFYLIEDEEWT